MKNYIITLIRLRSTAGSLAVVLVLSWPLTSHQLRGDVNKVHQGRLQRAADLPRGVPLHGLWRAVPSTLGWHLCIKVHLKSYLGHIFICNH